ARSPLRAQLHNRLRYLLRNDSRYALWEGEHGMLAGYAKWSGQRRTAALPPLDFAPGDLGEFVEKSFQAAAGPVTWKGLSSRAGELMGVGDHPVGALNQAEQVVAPERALEKEIDGRAHMATIWNEVLLLPAPQRIALLLNLRDPAGQGVIDLLPATGV